MKSVSGLLAINASRGFEDRETGAIRYSKPPRARYDCALCGGREGPAVGALRVREFLGSFRADHRARCSATSTAPQQGAHTA